MRTSCRPRVLWITAALAACIGVCASVIPAAEKKLKAEDIVARHLGSIGPAEARAAAKSRVADGAADVVFRLGGQGHLAGKGQLISSGRKVDLALVFPSNEYRGEQIVFEGERVEVGQLRPGQRSPLSALLYGHDVVAREGLLGGVLSTAWPLLEAGVRQARLDYSGLKKIEGKQLHELKYRARKGHGDLQVALYFDPDTFRHLRSQYRLVRPADMAANPVDSSSQQDTVYTLWEIFDDFKEVDGLTLPMSYRLDLTIAAQNATILTQWQFRIAGVAHNPEVPPASFKIR